MKIAYALKRQTIVKIYKEYWSIQVRNNKIIYYNHKTIQESLK